MDGKAYYCPEEEIPKRTRTTTIYKQYPETGTATSRDEAALIEAGNDPSTFTLRPPPVTGQKGVDIYYLGMKGSDTLIAHGKATYHYTHTRPGAYPYYWFKRYTSHIDLTRTGNGSRE